MKLSDVIKRLNEIKENSGDLTVCLTLDQQYAELKSINLAGLESNGVLKEMVVDLSGNR